MRIPVSKYHGCGNDFVIASMDDLQGIDLSHLAAAVCDRHTGIGADGFIAVKEQPLEMIFYNQDGSRAPMCGNGIRCFAAYCQDQQIIETDEFEVQTLAGMQKVKVKSRDPFYVTIDMGEPSDDLERIGVCAPVWGKKITLKNQETVTLYSLFMGTIHTVVFCEHASVDMESIGRAVCGDPMFAQQTNVNFVEIIDREHMKVRTYERGCGMTLACGTGACASLVCANRLGKMEDHGTALLAEGELQLCIASQGHVMMSGPAVRIMKGAYEYESN